MSKVRRIDWSPDEWTAGTARLLTQREAAVYMAVLMAIYSRAGACPNDAGFVSGQFKVDEHESSAGLARSTRASIDRLIKLGKLRVSTDGQWLTNGRAEAELNKARERIGGTVRAGLASGHARRANRRPPADIPPTYREHPADPQRKSNTVKDLVRTGVRNHQPSTIKTLSESLTDAAREPSPELKAAQARAHTGPEEQKTSPPNEAGFSVGPPLPPSPFEGERRPPPPSPTMGQRLAEAAAKAREKLLKGGSS